jgi:hypothetical protein
MILGKNGFFVTPSDSLAVITSHMKYIPHFINHPATGVARSMPTSTAVDKVAERLGLNLYEVPTGRSVVVAILTFRFRCKQGRRKHQKIGGHRFQGHFRILKRAPKTFFPKMLATGGGGGEKNFPVIPYRNCTFLTKFFKTRKFPNRKGTFDVNLVFTATLACSKRVLFITKKALCITKKGTFSPLNWGGGARTPRFLRPWM